MTIANIYQCWRKFANNSKVIEIHYFQLNVALTESLLNAGFFFLEKHFLNQHIHRILVDLTAGCLTATFNWTMKNQPSV